MSTPKTPEAAADGYWTIQVVHRDRARLGRRYVCHAHDDVEARAIAGHLAGSGRDAMGYDYHRIDNPHGQHARTLTIGQSESIDNPDTWAVLQAARRSA